MTSLLDSIAYKAKAIVGAFIIALVSLAQWAVTDPSTAPAIQAVVPAPYNQFIPLILGVAGTLIGYVAIWAKSNGLNPIDTSAVAAVDPDMTTQMIGTINAKNSGEFTGVGAQ